MEEKREYKTKEKDIRKMIQFSKQEQLNKLKDKEDGNS